MEKPVIDEITKLQSEPNVTGVLVADNRGLCIFASGESKSETSGHITCIANNLSKIDKNDMYPTIILKSENKSYLIKSSANSTVSVLYNNKQ